MSATERLTLLVLEEEAALFEWIFGNIYQWWSPSLPDPSEDN